jgi:DNA-binding response OmpR family regulator
MVDSPAPAPVVLVVEDNAEIREFVARALALIGYSALEASDGASALFLLSERPDIALLLTDVMLPGGTNGAELARSARGRSATLKILFISGYADTVIDEHELDRLEASMLPKPFRVRDLEERLRHILSR